MRGKKKKKEGNGRPREKKSSVRWPHSDNKPGKSLFLEPFRNSTVVYTGGVWGEQDMQRACVLQHLIMNTKHKKQVKSHIQIQRVAGVSNLTSHFTLFCWLGPIHRSPASASLFKFQKSPAFAWSKSCHILISYGIFHWVLAYRNGRLWLACVFGCRAVSCNNIHLARVQPCGRLQ